MHLVEPEEVGPIEGDDPRITPPRPPHRRVSVSLVFTLSMLVAVVATIYLVLPARHNALATVAIEQHRAQDLAWDLDAPSVVELRAWAVGVVGKGVPLPDDTTKVIGARRIDVLHRPAAVMRLEIGGQPITYVVQNAHGITPHHYEQDDGDIHATTWRRGKFTCVAVGPKDSRTSWLAALPHK